MENPTPTPTAPATPTIAPPTSPISRLPALLSENWPWVTIICLAPLLILALLLVLWAWRRARRRPKPRPPIGSYLESVGISGGPRRFRLKPEGITIGRAPENDLVITQDFPAWETVSRHHARIYRQAGHWIVEDLGSMNGVYVNGRRTGRNLLRDGWRLGIGGVEFIFHAGAGEA